MSRRRGKQIDHLKQIEVRENQECAYVGQLLEKHYPGYRWFVQCTWSTGVVTVKNMDLHGDYGFVIHLKDLLFDKRRSGKQLRDDKLPIPVNAGGEMLARCGLPAGPRPDYMPNLERDLRNNVIMDTHGAGSK